MKDPKYLVQLAEEWYQSTTFKPCPERGTPEWDVMFESYLDYAFGDEAEEFDTESI